MVGLGLQDRCIETEAGLRALADIGVRDRSVGMKYAPIDDPGNVGDHRLELLFGGRELCFDALALGNIDGDAEDLADCTGTIPDRRQIGLPPPLVGRRAQPLLIDDRRTGGDAIAIVPDDGLSIGGTEDFDRRAPGEPAARATGASATHRRDRRIGEAAIR